MPGSSQSIAGPVTVLNTIMAEELSQFYAVLKEAPDFNKALHDLVRKAFIEHGRIIFNGNGYEEAWVEEAARRGAGEILLTSMDRDGTQDGFDIPLTRAVARAVPIPVIASGGLSNMADIEQLCAVESEGVEGVICGRAIYSGDLDFAAAQARADELGEA
jgi:tRNA-dihydrouridine synthase